MRLGRGPKASSDASDARARTRRQKRPRPFPRPLLPCLASQSGLHQPASAPPSSLSSGRLAAKQDKKLPSFFGLPLAAPYRRCGVSRAPSIPIIHAPHLLSANAGTVVVSGTTAHLLDGCTYQYAGPALPCLGPFLPTYLLCTSAPLQALTPSTEPRSSGFSASGPF